MKLKGISVGFLRQRTYVADNGVWDIWNTEEEIVGEYWIPKEEIHLVVKRI